MSVLSFTRFRSAVTAAAFLAGAILGLGRLQAQSTQVGSVAGQVVNEATKVPLQGATVTLASDSRITAFTGSGGSFRLTNVPTGAQTVVVDYTGLDTARVEVTVVAGQSSQADVMMTASTYKMEQFSVSAVREGQAMAINDQRTAPNVVNVVSTDAFGNVADTNAGNLLVKLPGVTPVRDEAEVYRVSVRGINPDLNSVSVDGTLLAGATTRGSNRSFEIDKISTNSIESIEVIKSPTPDMDADSIGGKINLKTKSAFDRPGREIQYSAGANIYLPRGRSHPSGSIIYSDILGADRKIGVALSGSFNRTFSPRSAFRAGYLNPTMTAPAPINDFQTAEDDILLDRVGVGAKVDYKLSQSTSLFVNSIYNNFKDVMRQHKQRVRLTGTGVVTRFDDLVTEFNNGQFEYEMESRTRTVKTGMLQIGGRTNRDQWEADYDISHSKSTGTEKRQNLSLRINGVGYRIDRTNRLHFPAFAQISGPDVSNYDYAYTDSLAKLDYHAWDRVTAGQFNLKRNFRTTLPTYLKAGIRYRSQEKRQDRANDRWVYVGPDGIAQPVNGVSDNNLNRFRDDGHRYSPIDGRYARPVWPNWDAMHQEIKTHPELFAYAADTSLENALKDDNKAAEDIYATYLMGNVKISKLSVLGGVRVERTDTSGTSPVQDRTKTSIRDRWGRLVSFNGSYTSTFPGLHLRYEAAPGLVLRASASTSIGRPNFSQLIPGLDIDLAANTIRQNNPNLKPQFSDNFDLSAEYYTRGIGLVSLTAFRKNITDFAFNTNSIIGAGANNGFEGQYEGLTLVGRSNGGWARVNGLEFNYQQQLTFLPGFLDAFGVYANGTLLTTEGTYENAVVVSDIAGFVKRTGNIGISYIKHGFTVRASLNYVGENMQAYNASRALQVFAEPRSTVDFSVKYAFRPRLNFFADVTNVFNEKYHQFTGVGYRQTNTQVYGARMTTGISGTF